MPLRYGKRPRSESAPGPLERLGDALDSLLDRADWYFTAPSRWAIALDSRMWKMA